MKVYKFINKKTGKQVCYPILSERQMENIMADSNEGFCLHCGSAHSGIGPDARDYTCENCGQPSVFGFEEIVSMGWYKEKAA